MPGFATPLYPVNRLPGRKPGGRAPADHYPTPPEVTRALLFRERFEGAIWEPACGDGAISKVLTSASYEVVSSDLHDYGFGESGRDFFRERIARAPNIVTNPPYGRGLADRFVEHALRLTQPFGGKVTMLLDLSSLCHPSRTDWWRAHRPSRIYAVDECECWSEDRFGPRPWHKATRKFMWVVWDHRQRSGAPVQLDWIETAIWRH